MIKYTGNSIILKKLPYQLIFTATLQVLIFTALSLLNFANCAITPAAAELIHENVPETAPFITIVNNTGTAAFIVHISEITSDYWGEDWLKPAQVIRNSESLTLQLEHPLSAEKIYDLRLIDYSGNTYTKRNIEISNNSRIVFRASDFSSGPPINIINNTGVTIWYAFISETTSLTWGKDMLFSDQMILNGESAMIRLPYSINEVNRYDIKLVEAHSRSEYIKMNVPVTSYSTVIFSRNDISIIPSSEPAVNQIEPINEVITPIVPAVITEPAELAQPAAIAESAEPTEPEKPAAIAESAQPATITESAPPAEPEEATVPVEPAESVEQTELEESAEPAELQEAAEPAETLELPSMI